MKNSNNNRIIDRTINIFRDYMREQAINCDEASFENARQCRMVAREGGFLAKFDRAVAADKVLRVFTDNDYKYGRAVSA
jgi:hypothetical protein